MLELIAEIGVNWNGSTTYLKYLAKECKALGCSAIKLQAFGKEHWENYPQFPNLRYCSVDENNVEIINDICKKVGIEWFCTPTYLKAVDFLEPFVNRYKIRFKDQDNKELIDKVVKTGKQVIISTQDPDKFDYKIKTLYCIPDYPTDFEKIEFEKIPFFYGYSNHCKNMMAIFGAAKRGAKMIEIHVTPGYDKPVIDNPVSFDMIDLGEIIRCLKH